MRQKEGGKDEIRYLHSSILDLVNFCLSQLPWVFFFLYWYQTSGNHQGSMPTLSLLADDNSKFLNKASIQV